MYSNLLCEAGLTLGWLLCAQETLSETIFSLRKLLKEVIDVRIVAKTRNEVAIASCRPMPPFAAKWMARINQLYLLEQQALAKPLRGRTPTRAPHKAQQRTYVIEECRIKCPRRRRCGLWCPLCACLALTFPSLLKITEPAKGKPKCEQEMSSYVRWCPLCTCMSRAAAPSASAASKFVFLITGSSPYMRSSASFSHESIVLSIIDTESMLVSCKHSISVLKIPTSSVYTRRD